MQTSTARAQKLWTRAKLSELYKQPLFELLHQAHSCYREYFPAQRIQLSTLLNVKTGGCQEDCKYCAQSIRYKTGLDAQKLMSVEEVVKAAQQAKQAGASRFCMGAAWRELKDRDLDKLGDMVQAVKAEGMETCMTLGMLSESQAKKLADYGLDYYNHNIDTSPEYYPEVITTRSFQDRLDTLAEVNAAGMKVCSGGILGMGESQQDRIGLLESLANLDPQPQSVPINMLVPIAGTPYEKQAQLDVFELVRTVAVARIAMPNAYVRLSAGRSNLSEEAQAMCFYAGANSIFYGDQLLTTPNNARNKDMALLEKLGLGTE